MDNLEGLSFIYMQGYSFFIVILANLLSWLMTKMTDFAKSGSKSKLNREIIVPIALQYFITYIIVQQCSTWRFNQDDDDSWNYNLLKKGIYFDLNSNWFQDVGQSIYEIMKFNMIMPIIKFLTSWVLRYAMRTWDQRNSYNIPKFCPGSYKDTRCKSV